jgi:ATP-dependent DNA ligase
MLIGLFELKHGALACVYGDRCELVSRNGNVFKRFDTLAGAIHAACKKPTIIDGEIVCFDPNGGSLFNELLFHRMEPHYFSFDLP